MRSLRPVSMVAWVFACHLRPSFGQLYQKVYRTYKYDKKRTTVREQYSRCQHCMVIKAGVSGISLDEVDHHTAKFTITGMPHTFVRVKMYCSFSDECSFLKESPTPISTSDKNLDRQEQMQTQEQSNSRLLCLLKRPLFFKTAEIS